MTGFSAFDPDRFVAGAAAPSAPEVVGMPRDWRHGMELLREAEVPQGADPQRWGQIVRDATTFATTRWFEALAAGWTLGSVFGFEPDQPDGFVGLVLDIRGDRVLHLEPMVATIKHGRGCRFHHRHMPDDSPLLWQLGRLAKAVRR